MYIGSSRLVRVGCGLRVSPSSPARSTESWSFRALILLTSMCDVRLVRPWDYKQTSGFEGVDKKRVMRGSYFFHSFFVARRTLCGGEMP